MAMLELVFIFLFAVLGGVLATRFRQPTVLGLLFVGALTGPNALGIISNGEIINIVIEIGAVLLLFTVGIEFNLHKLTGLGIKPFFVGILKLSLVFFVGYQIAILLDLSNIVALYIGVILSITSTVIFIKVLEQKYLINREEIPLLVAVLIIEDIFAIFALTFFSGLQSNDFTPFALATSFLLSLAILLAVYLLLQKIIQPLMQLIMKYSTDDTLIFTALALCAGMSYLAHVMGLSPSIGAFLAGSIVASLPESKMFDKAIHPFILTFTSLFFLSIGTLINIEAIISGWYLVLIFFVVSIFIKYSSIAFSTFLSGYTSRQAIFSGIAMLSVGEFSILIAKEANALNVGIDFVSITAVVIVLSAAAMSFAIQYEERIYSITKKLVPKKISEDLVFTAIYLKEISASFTANKEQIKHLLSDWKILFKNLSFIMVFVAISFLVWTYGGPIRTYLISRGVIAFYWIIVFVIMIFAIPSIRIVQKIHSIEPIIKQIIKHLNPDDEEKKIVHSVIMSGILFVITVIVTYFFIFMQVSSTYQLIPFLLLGITIIYFVRSISYINNHFSEERKSYKEKLLKSKLF